MKIWHKSVLVDEMLSFLKPEYRYFIDATLGEGGHSLAILETFLSLQGIGVDRDQDILKIAKKRLNNFVSRFSFYEDWFDSFFLHYPLLFHVDFILFDLGLSMYHYKSSVKGFSFQGEQDLDMNLSESDHNLAHKIINLASQEELEYIFTQYAQEKKAYEISQVIVKSRRKKYIRTTKELWEAIMPMFSSKIFQKNKIHPLTRIFQALRISVNQELKRLESVIYLAVRKINPGGRICFISYHSGEDRIIKQALKKLSQEEADSYFLPFKKVKKPTWQEIKNNTSSRSAKLRVIERCD